MPGTQDTLPPPARYFPVRVEYDLRPGLMAADRDHGNGRADALLFALDSDFARFRANRLRKRREPVERWHCDEMAPDLRGAAVGAIGTQLCLEHPEHFHLSEVAGVTALNCGLSGERLEWEAEGDLVTSSAPGYLSALDGLASQVQDDIAVFQLHPDGSERLAAYQICSPSGWAPEEKRGRDFLAIHEPVPGFAAALKGGAAGLVRTLTRRGPFVRFGWGLSPDDALDRHSHPVTPHTGWPDALPPSGEGNPFWLRVERQVLWPLPEVSAFLFLIRLYFTPASEIMADPEKRALMAETLRAMPEPIAAYKGIDGVRPALIAWLEPPQA